MKKQVWQPDNQLLNQFDKLLAEQFKPDASGCAALVAHKGQLIYYKAFGMANLELEVPMKPEHVFRIGSITKQFTAIAILQLLEQNKLSLQDDITCFFPDYPTQGNSITIEHLLTHTSGIKSYTQMPGFRSIEKQDMSSAELIDFFKSQPLEFEPGTQWSYSNSGYFLLGYIIEKVSGSSYAQYIEEVFFRPLEMTSSYYGDNAKLIKNRVAGYQIGPDGVTNADYMSMSLPSAAGALLSTVGDLWKWHQAVHSYRLVNKETLDKAFTPYQLSTGQPIGYGYGWSLGNIQGSSTLEHGGGINGFLTTGIYLPQEDVFVALFSNNMGKPTDGLAAEIAALTMDKPYPLEEIDIDESILSSYTGVYENDQGILRVISSVDQHLYSQRSGSLRLHLKPYQRDKFFIDHLLTTFAFIRNRNGQVDQIHFQNRERSEIWQKTNKPVPPVRASISLSDAILASYVGDYQLAPNLLLTVTKEQNQLLFQATGQNKFALVAETETTFHSEAFEALVEFIKDETGEITNLILLHGGRPVDARRIR